MADLLGISVSGLLASNRVLTTIGHNVANANTDGYSRQQVDLAARTPQLKAGQYEGTGVTAVTTKRVVDSFITGQVRSATSNVGYATTFNELSGAVNNLLADSSAGLAPAIQDFFSSVHEVANDPGSTSARQVMLSQGQTLVQRFQSLDSRLSDLDGAVNDRVSTLVSQVNQLSSALAQVNHDIIFNSAAGSGQQPNDLLDQRDELLRKLSQLVNITSFEQSDGTINVAVGTGQVLVAGSQSKSLAAVQNPADTSRIEVAYQSTSGNIPISDYLSGGELAGVLKFRSQVLEPAHNALGRVAVGLASSFNDQHALGVTLNGALGGNFFSDVAASSTVVLANTANTGSPAADVTASITDPSALTASNYVLRRTGASYTLTRLQDNQVTTLSSFPGGAETVDGVTLSLSSGAIADGDSFVIQPTREASRELSVVVQNPEDIAAAGALKSQASTANLGGGAIGPVSVTATTNLPLSGAGGSITLTYSPNALGAGVPGFTVSGGPGGTLAYDPATDASGKQFTLAGYGDASFEVSGVPQSGDTFTIADNVGGVGDGTNVLALANLQTKGLFDGGTATYEDAYGSLVVDVGSRTQQSNVNLQAQQTLLQQATDARDTVSGVNLDEEAANLLRYQQAYQASAQVIATAGTLFDALLGAVGR